MESFQPIIFSYRLVIKCHPSRTQSTREEPTIIIIQSCKLKPQTLKIVEGLVSLPLLPVQS